jgi:hypothetical protein
MYTNDGWNTLYLENHDQPRSVTRYASGEPEYCARSSKMLFTSLGYLAGTPFIYEGQELGMSNVPKWSIQGYKDLKYLNHWREVMLSCLSSRADNSHVSIHQYPQHAVCARITPAVQRCVWSSLASFQVIHDCWDVLPKATGYESCTGMLGDNDMVWNIEAQ